MSNFFEIPFNGNYNEAAWYIRGNMMNRLQTQKAANQKQNHDLVQKLNKAQLNNTIQYYQLMKHLSNATKKKKKKTFQKNDTFQ